MLICPKEINFNDIKKKKSLSASNFSKIDIKKEYKQTLSEFLDEAKPFETGEEPGSFAYVKSSRISFLRNSCIDSLNSTNQIAKEIFINPKYGYSNSLIADDILLCKDANIGDTCLFIPKEGQEYVFSSGVVKLNFKDELSKYYALAFLRDEYFQHQLDAKTPRGSTIRHAGTNFIDCLLPSMGIKEREVTPALESLLKNIAYAERMSFQKLETANELIKNEFLVEHDEYDSPSISEVLSSSRLDAGYYSQTVGDINFSLNNYKNGYKSLEELGFKMKRGPNLQKRDLGRSIKSNDFKPNYHCLVYPSDISDNGYILQEVYIGARNPVWYMKEGDILFSAEGTVGKVFIICNQEMKFITNIHGLIISPTSDDSPLENSIILGQYLHFLRSYGFFDKVSVGGQGGSFAVNYWHDFKIPVFSDVLIKKIAALYHSGAKLKTTNFCLNELQKAGVFELNNFRIRCNELIKIIVNDIKNDETKSVSDYESLVF